MSTVSTDDAYVNGHFTAVAPRVDGQVEAVFVDDNMRVRTGEVLVRLDREPYEVVVHQKEAMLEVARANLRQAEAGVRALEATARSRRWRLQSAMEQVNNDIAALKAAVAVYDSRRATVDRARADYIRAERLFGRGAASQEELDARREAIRVAQAHANEALAQVQQSRVSLGLPATPPKDKPLTDVPPDLDETFSSVRVALSDLVQTAAQLGLPLAASEARPREFMEAFRKQDAGGDIDALLRRLVKQSPDYLQAEASVAQAERDLEQAKLDLSYCEIVAEIDGVVTRRNVNPGNYVKIGQSLMAVRSVTDIWIDANFKETQLDYLRIGLPVDVYADMYGSRRVFRGRISGFTMGTGSTLSLLPPQNATGNFVKVVQRLPVRIDLLEPNPEDTPLYIGLSVVPYVHYKERPTGPDAGGRLRQGRDAGVNPPGPRSSAGRVHGSSAGASR
jgi:membrane fusion protein (multidrug efflux system)